MFVKTGEKNMDKALIIFGNSLDILEYDEATVEQIFKMDFDGSDIFEISSYKSNYREFLVGVMDRFSHLIDFKNKKRHTDLYGKSSVFAHLCYNAPDLAALALHKHADKINIYDLLHTKMVNPYKDMVGQSLYDYLKSQHHDSRVSILIDMVGGSLEEEQKRSMFSKIMGLKNKFWTHQDPIIVHEHLYDTCPNKEASFNEFLEATSLNEPEHKNTH